MENSKMKIVTCVAPVNIAVIKYWGKSNEELIIPLNDSLSGTLSTDVMCAKTTIMASPGLKQNKFWLNGKEETFNNVRLDNCLKEVKRRADPDLPILNWKISICSENNFPTAAGLASSAAGYACLVFALAVLYEIQGDISSIARLGSGSACRSMYGGWVKWCKGSDEKGTDSVAKQIASASHWPGMKVLILVVSDIKKKCSSTEGMKRCAETSELLKYRLQVIPKRIEAITEAIKEKDFHTFAQLTMQDSNELHAVCLDTYPPCVYMNDISHAIAEIVHSYNQYKSANKVAYTFDAGPNACLYLREPDLEEFVSVINYTFPPPEESEEYFKGIPLLKKPISEDLKSSLNLKQYKTGSLKCIIHTEIGDGPKIVTESTEHLLNELGIPKYL